MLYESQGKLKTKVVYILVSNDEDSFYEMFLLSLASLRAHDLGREVILVLDTSTKDRLTSKREPLLDGVIIKEVEVPSVYDVTQRSRYLKTKLRDIIDGDFLYLDVDTVICDSFDEIDSIEADLAAVADDNGAVKVKNRLAEDRSVKAGFGKLKDAPFYNGGVFLVRESEDARRLFNSWHERWLQSLKNGVSFDQPALCQANLDVGCPIKELPGEWNCQVCSAVGPYYFKKAKVIHYYASYGSFKDAVFISRIKHMGRIDSVSAAFANAPKSDGIGIYHQSYKGHLRYLSSWILHGLVTMPFFYRLSRDFLFFISKPLSWMLLLKRSVN